MEASQSVTTQQLDYFEWTALAFMLKQSQAHTGKSCWQDKEMKADAITTSLPVRLVKGYHAVKRTV
jgi:hypothetical protein